MEMVEMAARFRAATLKRAGIGPRTKYTGELKGQAVAYGKARLAEGAALAVVAQELGVDERALKRWSAEVAQARPGFRRVEVQPEATPRPTPGTLVLSGPGGLRVEGLDVETLAELLRRLR